MYTPCPSHAIVKLPILALAASVCLAGNIYDRGAKNRALKKRAAAVVRATRICRVKRLVTA